MPEGIIASRSQLIDLANRECGYRAVTVGAHDTGRISNKGNLVIEHADRGTQDVCRDGDVLSRNQPLQHGKAPASVTFSDRDGHVTGYTPPSEPTYSPPPPSYSRNSP